jgi:hypothetical protein
MAVKRWLAKRHFVAVAVLASIPPLVLVATPAPAALHTLNDFSHGIVSTPGYDCNVQNQFCRAWVHDVDGTTNNAALQATMEHRYDNGTWHIQTSSSCNNCTKMWTDAPSGTAPCQKYAWTYGSDPTSYMKFHGLNTDYCGGNHVNWP